MSVAWSETKLVRVDFPSMQPIKGHRRGDDVYLFRVRLPDEKGRTKSGSYECIVDTRGRTATFVTHVLNLREGTRHPHLYQYSTVPGTTKRSLLVCQGDWSCRGNGTPATASGRIGAYLNHIISVLNS
ncbi:uncharacterized protein METZ01_LOCUS132032 [marine metagenome]|uniref:Uncharacterized protein n=1 Tax=marine metagenome TaxID=408172 RepID=A0A381YQ87_9ZZZZ